ncbi:MAG: ATP-binding protein [Anaerolineae bacterium]
MSVMQGASEILGSPQGSLVYHLLVFWAVVAALGMAWAEWRRGRKEQTQRLFLAMGGLVLVRVIYALIAIVGPAVGVEESTLLPPVERFVDTVSIGLLAWAFLPSSKHGARTWDWLAGANLALAVVICIAFTILWGQARPSDGTFAYHASWQADVWAVWQLVLILAASAVFIRSQGPGWGTLLSAMVVMFVGVLLQWITPPGGTDLPLLQRLANLVAYPLVAVAIYQEIMAGMWVQSRDLQDISQASLDQMKDLLNLFEAGQRTSGSLELSEVLDNAVEGIARVLSADQCAIVFPDETDSGTMRLVAIYNPTRQGRGEAVTFPREYQLKVQQAIRRRKPVIVEDSDNVQLRMLFALLGSGETGPLLVQPLVGEKETIGAIIAGNARSRRSFTANEAKLCQSMAGQVVAAIQNARLYESTRERIDTLSKAQMEGRRLLAETQGQLKELGDRLKGARAENDELKAREKADRETRNELEIRLASSRAEAEALSERMAVLETDLAQAHASAEAQLRWHEEELARLRAGWEDVPDVEEQRNRLETIASLSEEMRTPITTIMNYVDLLLSESVGGLDGAQRKFLTRIQAGAERLLQVSRDLADEVDGEEEWTRPHRRAVDVNKLVEATVAGSHDQLDENEVTLELDLPGDLPSIKADPDYLGRVLASLLSNACLASSEGGRIRVRTILSATHPLDPKGLDLNGDGFVIVSVKDSGGGLSDEAFSQIFDRSRPSQTPAGLGESGAGLALTKTLVEAQGGRLWVESETGIGTTFNLVLPVNSAGEHSPQEASVVPQQDGVRGEM